jgi:hypothetical protein
MFLILQQVTAAIEADERETIRQVRAVVSDAQYREILGHGRRHMLPRAPVTREKGKEGVGGVNPIGMAGEISYDLVMAADMEFVEGVCRARGGAWQVFVVNKADVPEARVRWSSFPGGVRGVLVQVPAGSKLDRRAVKRVLSEALGVERWVEVRGPDSMRLR